METHPTFARAALGGFVGTLAMTAMMNLVAPPPVVEIFWRR
jgi:hypothetical protein